MKMMELLMEFEEKGIILNYIKQDEEQSRRKSQIGWHCYLDTPKGDRGYNGIHVFGCATPIEALTVATNRYKEVERGIANE